MYDKNEPKDTVLSFLVGVIFIAMFSILVGVIFFAMSMLAAVLAATLNYF